MKTLMMQYEWNGEKWEIWETEEETLEGAWKEMGLERPEEGGCISFKGVKKQEKF